MSVNVDTSLDLARNMFGRLNPSLRKRLEAVVNKPNRRTWDNAYTIIVGPNGFGTLWQAVLAVDPTFCRSRPLDEPWPEVPTQKTLLKALHWATH